MSKIVSVIRQLWALFLFRRINNRARARQFCHASPCELLQQKDIGISRRIDSNANLLDLRSNELSGTVNELRRHLSRLGNDIYVYHAKVGWVNITTGRYKKSLLTPTSSGCVEIAIAGPGKQLKQRYSVYLWKTRSDYLECTSPYAPIKRVRNVDIIKPMAGTSLGQSCGRIDVVYTWVNADDPGWQQMASRFETRIDRDRFSQSDELRYSIRSVRLYAPWVRTIFIFSNCRPPEWFVGSETVKWVYHDEVIPREYLPTFNSHAVETYLHLIPGLSDQFIYMNDDFFLCGFVRPEDFFTIYGASVSRLESYGVVPYLEELEKEGRAEEWQCAAVNGARLIAKRFGQFPTRLHRHVPYALNKNVYRELCNIYEAELDKTRRAKFRTKEDVSFTSFLYPHFALVARNSVVSEEQAIVVRVTNYRRFQRAKLYRSIRFFCVNDGGGSSFHTGFQKVKSVFLPSIYPFRSDAEKAG